MSFIIRHGDEKDIPGIMKLVRELALFERAPEAVINTEKMLLADGFGKHSLYRVFIAEAADTNEVIGMALYYIAYSTWKGKMLFLDDLVVTESHRQFGIGRKLINEFLKVAKEEHVNEIRWQVLNWNTPAIEFYKSLNVTFEPDWITVKMNKDQISAYLENQKS